MPMSNPENKRSEMQEAVIIFYAEEIPSAIHGKVAWDTLLNQLFHINFNYHWLLYTISHLNTSYK